MRDQKLSYDQLKDLLQTDFFTIDQVKQIKSALLKNSAPQITLSDEQVEIFWRLSQGFEQ
jgi:hypothetical protein